MEGSSRGALAAGREQLQQLLTQADPSTLAEELLFIGATLDSSAALRRALADPSRQVEAKQQFAGRLFGGKVGDQAQQLLATLIAQRWSAERDLADALDLLGAEAVVAAAEQAGRLDQVEDELFLVERTVEGSPQLRDALSDRQRSGDDKSALLKKLLEGKAAPETVRLVSLAAQNPRGQRFHQALERYIGVTARRREQVVAVVTVAAPLDAEHSQRLTAVLSRIYDKPVQLNVVVDPEVIGGMHVRVGDEIIDGTVTRRLEDARRAMAG